MCTDGILERPDAAGDFYGTERLRELILTHKASSAEEILERLFDEVKAHGEGRPWEDDATVVIVKRPEKAEEAKT